MHASIARIAVQTQELVEAPPTWPVAFVSGDAQPVVDQAPERRIKKTLFSCPNDVRNALFVKLPPNFVEHESRASEHRYVLWCHVRVLSLGDPRRVEAGCDYVPDPPHDSVSLRYLIAERCRQHYTRRIASRFHALVVDRFWREVFSEFVGDLRDFCRRSKVDRQRKGLRVEFAYVAVQ